MKQEVVYTGKVYFIADTHFNHEKIIGYENRPFNSVEEMNYTLINNWNSVVNKDDRVFVLGDFLFHPNKGLDTIVHKLRGNKVLVMGNHDCSSVKTYLSAGFVEVYKYPIIFEGFWMLSHKPLYVNSNMPYVNIFGHVHGDLKYSDYTKQSLCASVERKHMNYTPISFDKVQELIGIEA